MGATRGQFRAFFFAGAMFAIGVAEAAAQSCSADVQCFIYGQPSRAECIGDMLVVKRGICVGGRCQVQEVVRQNCATGGGLGHCVGNVFVRSGGRCDAISARCVSGSPQQTVCVPSCSCRRNLLVISTGQCSPTGCGRAVVRCKRGCTCSPTARCLEDPPGKKRGP